MGQPTQPNVATGPQQEPVPIRTPDQRLRIFVSSTLQELAPERGAARQAIEQLRLTPVMFEAGARPHAPRALYRAYLAQSDVFVGLYWERYGWIAPGEQVSGLEDEYRLSAGLPRLLYVKTPAARREPELARMLQRIQADDTASYKSFSDPAELSRLLTDDIALLLTERFAVATDSAPTSVRLDLPVPPTRLIDRTAELDQVAQEFADAETRLVTLTGPGGVGKTRLAIAAAERIRDRDHVEAGFVSLAAIRDPALVPTAIAAVVGLKRGSDDIEAALIRALRERNVLLVLDNFEHVVAAAPFVARLLAALQHLRVLATSREPLRIGAENVVSIQPLPVQAQAGQTHGEDAMAPAVQLFVERAEAVRAGVTRSVDPAVLTEIAERLDGLPLAIELAAARTLLLDPKALLGRLSSRLTLLTGGDRDLPERQRTLRATLDWSHDLLSRDERTVFARLSIFRGGARLAEVERVCADGLSEDLLDLVAALVEKSLLETLPADGDPRVGMLESVREYAGEQLVASGELEAVEDRRDAAYLAMATQAQTDLRGPDETSVARRLERDIDNLRALAEHALAIGRVDRAVDLLYLSIWFWWVNGHLAEARRWLDDVAKSGGLASLGPPERARYEGAQAITLFWSADLDGVVGHADVAIEGLRASGDSPGLATALLVRAMSMALSGKDLVSAQKDLAEARNIQESLNEPWLGAYVGTAEGYVANLAGDVDRALAAFERAAGESDRRGDWIPAAMGLDTLGQIYLERGQLQRSADRFHRALEIGLETGLSERFGYVLRGVAGLSHQLGDDDAAAHYIGAADSAREAVTPVWLSPSAAAEWDLLRSRVRDALGDEPYEAATAEGRSAGATAMAERAVAHIDGIQGDEKTATCAPAAPTRQPA